MWQKEHHTIKDFLLMDFMSQAQQFTKQILLLNTYLCSKGVLLCMQVNLGLRETNKRYWPHKKIRWPVLNLIPFYSSAFPAKSLRLKFCCKSEAQKRFSIVSNDNKAFRRKIRTGKLWKCMTPETDGSTSRNF